jgi:1-acyl-sn-glycerol-3-phosphate acyltransferase
MTPNQETTQRLTMPTQQPSRGTWAALTWCYQTLAFYTVLAIFALVFFGWSIPATLLYWLLPKHLAAPAGQYMIMIGSRGLLSVMQASGLARFDLTALDALRTEGGLVIAPNHPSLIDVLLVASRLPRIVCITKAALWNNPLCGAAARLAGYIRNDTPHTLVRAAASAVADGNQLLIFPEGTRSRMTPIGPFKGGFVLMARQAGVPIQTVLIQVNPPYLGKGWGLFRRPDFPIVYRARLGRRYDVEGPAQQFSGRLHDYFTTELDRR